MAITNNNASRTITNTAEGGDLTTSDVQTIEVTPSEVAGTEVIQDDNNTGTITITTYTDEVTVRKENGEVRATIKRS
jgi:hypothetical protein